MIDSNFLSCYVSALPLLFIIYLVINLLTIRTYKFIYLFFIIFVAVSTEILKQSPYESIIDIQDKSLLYRPKGAHDCDFFSLSRLEKPNIRAMPSGHMALTSFFVSVSILSLLKYNNMNLKLLGIVANVTLLILMGWSRMQKLCHNKYQVFFGTMYGSMIGILYFNLFN